MKKMLIVLLISLVALVGFASAGSMQKEGACKQDMKSSMDTYCAKYPIDKCAKDMSSFIKKMDCLKYSSKKCNQPEPCNKRDEKQYCDGCCDNCKTTCCYYDYCPKCNEKHYADGYCDQCGEKSAMYMHCPYCEKDYAYSGRLSCPDCGKDGYLVEHCDKCYYTHNYDGYCQKCHEKCLMDKYCTTSCEKCSFKSTYTPESYTSQEPTYQSAQASYY